MINRRKFLLSATATLSSPLWSSRPSLAANRRPLEVGGQGYSQLSGTELESSPSLCAECPSRCAIIGYRDAGRLVKVEGNPASKRSQGKLCAKGQASVTGVYDPDRLVQPMMRSGKRGEGSWKVISWDQATTLLLERLKKIREQDQAERFLLHHGVISDSAEWYLRELFMPAFGSASILTQDCRTRGNKTLAQLMTWGVGSDTPDLENARLVLNFGGNPLESDRNMLPLARRMAAARVDNNLKVVTFDLRLSNTAARSDQWVPIKPGSDAAVMLSLCNLLLSDEQHMANNREFLAYCQVGESLEAGIDEKIELLRSHLQHYTPEWAEQQSGVEAGMIEKLAAEVVAKGSACVITSRAVTARVDGIQTERAAMLLAALSGGLDAPGGRCRAIKPEWVFPEAKGNRESGRRMAFLERAEAEFKLPLARLDGSALARIKESGERPEVYLWYHHNPVVSAADSDGVRELLADESLLPFTVAVTPFYDESAALADLILPDVTPLEGFAVESMESPNLVPEYAIRQPVIEPRGEARDFIDVCCELAGKLKLNVAVKSHEDLVEKAAKLTPVVKRKAQGFRGLVKKGLWFDKKATPQYYSYARSVAPEGLSGDTVLFDTTAGVYWDWQLAGLPSREQAEQAGYLGSESGYLGYLARQVEGVARQGFHAGPYCRSGLLQLYSPEMVAAGMPGLPVYSEQKEAPKDTLQLSSYRLNVHSAFSTANMPWLSEIEYQSTAWLNPQTAREHGVKEGDRVKLVGPAGSIETRVSLSQGVVPGSIAMPLHFGRTEGGRYASGGRAPESVSDEHHDAHVWWEHDTAGRLNRMLAIRLDPMSGSQAWMDQRVKLEPMG